MEVKWGFYFLGLKFGMWVLMESLPLFPPQPLDATTENLSSIHFGQH